MLLIQITAAHGPTECEHAARLTLRELLHSAEREGTGMQLLEESHACRLQIGAAEGRGRVHACLA